MKQDNKMPVILGNPIKTTNLVIRGAPDIIGSGTLYIEGPTASSGDISLFMARPPTETMPLTINSNSDSSNVDTSLYISSTDGSYDDWSPTSSSPGDDVTHYSPSARRGHDVKTKKINVFYKNAGEEGYIFFRAEHRDRNNNILSKRVGSASGAWQTGASVSAYNPASPFTSGGEEWQLRAVTGSQAGSGYIDLDLTGVYFAPDDKIHFRWDSETSIWSDPPSYTSTLTFINDQSFPSGYQQDGNLRITGTEYSPKNATATLNLQADRIGSGVNQATVFVSGVFASVNKEATLFSSGADAGAVNENSTLFIESNPVSSGSMNLAVKQDFNIGSTTTLAIFSRAVSGNIPLYMNSGVFGQTGDASLNIGNTKDPQPNNITLYTKGYLE